MSADDIHNELTNELKWLNRPMAGLLIDSEINRISTLLPDRYYAVGLQLGIPAGRSYFDSSEEALKIYLDCYSSESQYGDAVSPLRITCDNCHLPFGRRAADLIIMPHTLDLSVNPTQVLREVNQVIDEDGILVLTGFNPASLTGLTRKVSKKLRPGTNLTTSHTPGRVKEWLQLIGFEVYASCYLDYLPPINNARARKLLAFMDKAGERWWPVLASVYIIVARKQVWKPEKVSMLASIKKRLNPKIAQPASRQRV